MLDVRTSVSARPHILTGLLELTGPKSVSDREFVALFENPLLQQAVTSCWDDIKALLDAGLELRGKSITRLRHDVEKLLHAEIVSLRNADSVSEDAEEADPTGGDAEHIALLNRAETFGYRPIELLAELREQGKLKDERIADLVAQNEKLRDAVRRFGRKKARWLKRQDSMRKASTHRRP